MFGLSLWIILLLSSVINNFKTFLSLFLRASITGCFPTIKYDPTGNGYTTEIKDILTRVAVKKWLRNQIALFSLYDVPDGATPDQVAFYLYNDTEYHWVVLIFNETIDSYCDRLLSLCQNPTLKSLDDKSANDDVVPISSTLLLPPN